MVGPPSRWRLRDLPWLLAAVTLAKTADLLERLRRQR